METKDKHNNKKVLKRARESKNAASTSTSKPVSNKKRKLSTSDDNKIIEEPNVQNKQQLQHEQQQQPQSQQHYLPLDLLKNHMISDNIDTPSVYEHNLTDIQVKNNGMQYDTTSTADYGTIFNEYEDSSDNDEIETNLMVVDDEESYNEEIQPNFDEDDEDDLDYEEEDEDNDEEDDYDEEERDFDTSDDDDEEEEYDLDNEEEFRKIITSNAKLSKSGQNMLKNALIKSTCSKYIENDPPSDNEDIQQPSSTSAKVTKKRTRKAKVDNEDGEPAVKKVKKAKLASALTEREKFAKNVVVDNNNVLHFKDVAVYGEPNFYNAFYCIKRITTHDLPFFDVRQFNKALDEFNIKSNIVRNSSFSNEQRSKASYQFLMCRIHGPTCSLYPNASCSECVLFEKFSYTFSVKTNYFVCTFPLPVIYTNKALNFFRSFVKKASHDTLSPILRKDEYTSYMNFMSNGNFNGGDISSIIAGKKSWIRKRMLAFPTLGMRLTLTVKSDSPPGVAHIPRKLYERANMNTCYALLNRSPSINSLCIYLVRILPHDNDDNTIRVNGYILDGLHADQDGDDLQLLLFSYNETTASFEMKTAMKELQKFSWEYGTRHDILYRPRYSFSQYHRFLLHNMNDYFCQHSPLWNSLSGSPLEKAKTVMDLGCSIMYDEVDEFLRLVEHVTRTRPLHSISVQDIISGENQMREIVDSGAKGTIEHIRLVRKNLLSTPTDFEKTMVDTGFNKFVKSGINMSREGVSQFTLLYSFNSLILHRNNIYLNGNVIMTNADKAQTIQFMNYNHASVKYIFDSLLRDVDVFEYFTPADLKFLHSLQHQLSSTASTSTVSTSTVSTSTTTEADNTTKSTKK